MEERSGGSLPDFIVDRVLLTNDNGIDAPGIRLLEDVAITLAREVWVVTSEHNQRVSHIPSASMPPKDFKERAAAIQCFRDPGDCVVAVQELTKDKRPDLVLSGVNRGANLGVETVFSGNYLSARASTRSGPEYPRKVVEATCLYTPEALAACEKALRTILTKVGPWGAKPILIGGMVPSTLWATLPPI